MNGSPLSKPKIGQESWGIKGHYGSNPVDAMAAQIILEAWLNDPANTALSE
ncbi:hypothetical protein [Endozoicomonas sp.]|uniref:hypothetical protein n=1 Tax=Endozoicomonas sp. TaxID=1892382 RepID=UPI002885E016|nr:hypothetical protein [Endozoicomonas sp.]